MEVRLGTTPTLRLVPDEPMASPTGKIYDVDGTTVATIVPVPSAVSTTVDDDDDEANTRARFHVVSATGIARGLTLRVNDAQWGEADAVVASVDELWVRTVEPLPGIPTEGATVIGLTVECTLPEAATDEIADGFRLELLDGDVSDNLTFNVVRWPFVGPCKAMHVRKKLASRMSSLELEEQDHETMADDVNAEIRGRLMAARVQPSSFWDKAALKRLLSPTLNLYLADERDIWPANYTLPDYVRLLETKIRGILDSLLKSAEPVDENRDGELTPTEAKGTHATKMAR